MGQVSETSFPRVDKFSADASCEVLCFTAFKEVLATKDIPGSDTKVIANENLDIVVAPHVIDLGDLSGGGSWRSRWHVNGNCSYIVRGNSV